MKQIRKHPTRSNVLLILIVVVLAVVAWYSGTWFYAGSVETWGPLHTYIFICLSIAIASIAALNSIFASTIASDTQRPFLSRDSSNMSVETQGKFRIIPFTIENFGTLPASDITVGIDFFYKGEAVTEKNKSEKFPKAAEFPTSPMIFPRNSYVAQYILSSDDKNDVELLQAIKEGRVTSRLRIEYKGLDKSHFTIQTERIEKNEFEKGLTLVPIAPQVWK